MAKCNLLYLSFFNHESHPLQYISGDKEAKLFNLGVNGLKKFGVSSKKYPFKKLYSFLNPRLLRTEEDFRS